MRKKLFTLGATALVILGGANVAEAVEPMRTTYTVVTEQLPLDSTQRFPVAQLSGIPLEAGKAYWLNGQMTTTPDYLGALQALQMRCWAAGVPVQHAVWTTRNHLAPENAVPADPDTIYGQWLFTPSVAGDYSCDLYASSGRNPYPDGYDMQYLTVNAVKLQLDPNPRVGVEWRQPEVVQVGPTLKGYADQKWILVKRWDAPENAATIRVYSGVQLSSISTGSNTASMARVTQYVTQLTAEGTMCKRYTSAKLVEVLGKLHHEKVLIVQPSVPVDQSCTSKRFAIQTLVEYVSAEEVPPTLVPERHGMQVEGPSYTAGHVNVASTTPLAFKTKKLPRRR